MKSNSLRRESAQSVLSRRAWLAKVGGASLAAVLHARLGAADPVRNPVGVDRPLGIFSHIVPGTHAEKAKALREAGFTCVQWYPLLDKDEMSEANFRRVAATYSGAGIALAAVSGYANLFDPRPDVRKAERDRLSLTLKLAPVTGCSIVATETGTLNPLKVDHADNTKPEIWREFVELVGRYLEEAKAAGSYLALEAYTKNICRDGHDVARLLKEVGSTDRLRFVMDPFNVVYERELSNQRPVIDAYFQVMRGKCVIAHAKDLTFEKGDKVTPRAGAGVFDWKSYGELLHQYEPTTPLILEHLKWPEVQETLAYVKKNLVS